MHLCFLTELNKNAEIEIVTPVIEELGKLKV